jgi:hypothetical protein
MPLISIFVRKSATDECPAYRPSDVEMWQATELTSVDPKISDQARARFIAVDSIAAKRLESPRPVRDVTPQA